MPLSEKKEKNLYHTIAFYLKKKNVRFAEGDNAYYATPPHLMEIDHHFKWYTQEELTCIATENEKIANGKIKGCQLGLEDPSRCRRIKKIVDVVLKEQQRQKSPDVRDNKEEIRDASLKDSKSSKFIARSRALKVEVDVMTGKEEDSISVVKRNQRSPRVTQMSRSILKLKRNAAKKVSTIKRRPLSVMDPSEFETEYE